MLLGADLKHLHIVCPYVMFSLDHGCSLPNVFGGEDLFPDSRIALGAGTSPVPPHAYTSLLNLDAGFEHLQSPSCLWPFHFSGLAEHLFGCSVRLLPRTAPLLWGSLGLY